MKENRQSAVENIRGVDSTKRTVDIVASDYSIDSYGTRIDPNGWDLEQYRKNPVICLQHDSYDDLPVAFAIPESVRIDNAKLLMTVQFPPEGASEDSDKAFNLISAGVLRGVSVGFDPTEVDQTQETDNAGMKVNVTIFRKQKLLEVSFVTIPSNDNGLVVRSRELNQDVKKLRTLAKEMETQLKAHKDEIEAGEKLTAYKASYLLKAAAYMEGKQPANREATKVMDRFFKKILQREQPADETEAWKEMGEAVDAMEETTEVVEPVEKAEEKSEPSVVEELINTPVEIVEETTIAPIPEPEAPAPERKAFVQVPLSDLLELPARLTKSYLDTATEALLRGITIKDAEGVIDGMNNSVTTSISKVSHGHN